MEFTKTVVATDEHGQPVAIVYERERPLHEVAAVRDNGVEAVKVWEGGGE